MAERKSYDPPHGFCIQTLSVFVSAARIYRPLPGLRSPSKGVPRIASPTTCIKVSVGLSPLGGSPEYTHGVRRLTMLVHRFNAQPMTIQRLHCCLSSPHRICLAVSMAVVPSKRNSSMFGSRQQVCERSTAIQLSSYEGERVFPSTKCWVHKSPLVVEKYLKKISGIFAEHLLAQ